MQDGEPNDLVTLVANDHIIICELAVRCLTRLLKVNVQDICLSIVRRPKRALRSLFYNREEFQVFLNIRYGHTCFLFSKDRSRRVKNAVITKPSSTNSR